MLLDPPVMTAAAVLAALLACGLAAAAAVAWSATRTAALALRLLAGRGDPPARDGELLDKLRALLEAERVRQ